MIIFDAGYSLTLLVFYVVWSIIKKKQVKQKFTAMRELWFILILTVLLALYYLSNRSTWKFSRMYTDNLILRKLQQNTDAELAGILHECGADVFELKNVDNLSRKESNQYFEKIEHLFDDIKSYFKSECAQLLIDRRHDDVDYVLKVEKYCKNFAECKECKLKSMKRQLKY